MPHVLVAAVTKDLWSPGIGDPTFMGWFTVAAYALTAAACGRAALLTRNDQTPAGRNGIILWTIMAAGMLLLGINKQLDLQSLVTVIGRNAARAQGWYQARREVQALFVTFVGVVGLAALAGLAWLTRGSSWPRWIALSGAVYLLSFIVIRAASFHHIDHSLKAPIGGLRLNVVLELGGILSILVGACSEIQLITRGPRLIDRIERAYAKLRGIDLDARRRR